jgi:hypothetical protein
MSPVVLGRLRSVRGRGVLLVASLSFIVTYLIAPPRVAASRQRCRDAGGTVSGPTTLVIYGIIAAILLPIWAFNGPRFGAALERMRVLVPEHTVRFVDQLHATEGWYESLGLPAAVESSIGAITRRVTRGLEIEVRSLGAELVEIRAPCHGFRRCRWSHHTAHTMASPGDRPRACCHPAMAGDEFLRDLDGLMAAYAHGRCRRHRRRSLLIGFATPTCLIPARWALPPGCWRVPLAGPIVAAVVATAAARTCRRVALPALRVLQDYVVYPRLIKRCCRPLAVVLAIGPARRWGVVGCAGRSDRRPDQGRAWHWREYRDRILVAEAPASSSSPLPSPPQVDRGHVPANRTANAYCCGDLAGTMRRR